jgi:hypothetical protein
VLTDATGATLRVAAGALAEDTAVAFQSAIVRPQWELQHRVRPDWELVCDSEVSSVAVVPETGERIGQGDGQVLVQLDSHRTPGISETGRSS